VHYYLSYKMPRASSPPVVNLPFLSVGHPLQTTYTRHTPLWPYNHLPTYLNSLAAITFIFILFTFLFSDFIPSPLLPIDDPFFSNARSFGSYRFRTRMYSVSRALATTRRNIKKRRSKKAHTWIYDHEEISLDFTFDI
jgi:hypothetical protein